MFISRTSFLVGVCLCISTPAHSTAALFKQMEEVWDVEDYVHLVIEVDFKPIIIECKQVAETLHHLDKLFKHNMDVAHQSRPYPVSTKAVMSLAAQVCAITAHWELDQRVKRQLLEFAAGSIFGALLSTWQVGKLSDKISKLDAKLQRGIVVLANEQTRMSRMESDFNRTNTRLIWELFLMGTTMGELTNLLDVNTHLQALGAHTAAISRSWDALNGGRISLDLLALDQWKTVAARAVTEANRMGGRLPVDAPRDLLQFPVSFATKAEKWRVIIHLPVIQREISLFQHFPQPLILPANNDNKEDQLLELHSNKELILVTQDDSLHREISRTELQAACHQIGRRLLCEDLGIMYRNLQDTCLGALFSQATSAALQLCQIKKINRDWHAVYIPPSKVVLYSKKGRKVDALCSNGSRVHHKVDGIQEISLEEGCTLSSDKFIARRSASEAVEIHLMPHSEWNSQEIEEAWTRLRNASQQRAETTAADLTRTPTTQSEQERFQEDRDWIQVQLDPKTPQGRQLIVGLISTSIVLLVTLLSVASYLVWRFRRQPEAAEARATRGAPLSRGTAFIGSTPAADAGGP